MWKYPRVNLDSLLILCLVPVFLGRIFAADDSWPMLAHDPARSGTTTQEIRPPFERKWYRLFPDEGIFSGVQPIVADGKVFIGTMKGILHAIDAETGKDVWTFDSWRGDSPFCRRCRRPRVLR